MIDRYGKKHIDVLRDWDYVSGHRQFDFDIQTIDGKQIQINLSIEAALILASEVLRMHDSAWRDGNPHDVMENETMPNWVMPNMERKYFCRKFK